MISTATIQIPKMPSTCAALLLLLCLLLVINTTTVISTTPIIGLDSFLTQQSHIDPHARNDTFSLLPSSLKSHLSHRQTLPMSSLVTSLLSLTVPISLHVRLVGPTFPSNSHTSLSSFLSASLPSSRFHVISPFHGFSHRLSTKHALHLDVTHSSSLYSQLSQALKSEITKTPSSLRSSLVAVSYDVIDDIIKKDFEKEKPVQGVFVYLLDLGGVIEGKKYAYSYTGKDSSAGYTNCLGTIWTGKERYVWVDLGAGPVDYGPAISGDGVLPRGEFHPLAALHGKPKSQKGLLADLASLVWSAYQVLVVPSLRIPVTYENELVVEFVHVYGSESGKDTVGLDWKSIERTFMDEADKGGLLVGDQRLKFRHYEVEFDKCSVCSFAISRSMSSYTSRFLFENYTLIVSEYVDSKKLHHILTESAEEFRRVAGMSEEDFGRVIPVYVFDLDYHMPLLLDRYHQSVAFKDMVIALRTKNAQTVSEYNCNGRHVFIHTRELERPLVGSILQSMWGVSPTHLQWSNRHNSTLVDYTWSVGQTPFGPFSESSSLSFVQMDAARRNVLLTSLNYSIMSAIDVLESIASHGGDQNLLKGSRHVEFVQRWNLFKYKLDKAVSALSHFDFEMALYYIKSSDHDLYTLHSIVYHASEELDAALVCFKDPPFPWASVSMSVVAFVALFYIYARRDKLFRNKRKQF